MKVFRELQGNFVLQGSGAISSFKLGSRDTVKVSQFLFEHEFILRCSFRNRVDLSRSNSSNPDAGLSKLCVYLFIYLLICVCVCILCAQKKSEQSLWNGHFDLMAFP